MNEERIRLNAERILRLGSSTYPLHVMGILSKRLPEDELPDDVSVLLGKVNQIIIEWKQKDDAAKAGTQDPSTSKEAVPANE